MLVLLCRVFRLLRRLAKLVAEVEHQETLDRILLEMPAITPAALEQRARVELCQDAVRILRDTRGDEYEAWLTAIALGKAGERGRS